jgi:uncharacterized protein (TIGR01777 family)
VATYLISGASGFIGSHLAGALAADGHQVIRLKRGRAGDGDVPWDPEAGVVDTDRLARAPLDVVINLAGEPIARRWTSGRKRRIRTSRVNGTRALATALASMNRKPSALVSGSAIGYYGARRGDEILDEGSAPGSDYLAETAREWEQATAPATDAGIRVVTPRTGIVLGAEGGALAKILPPFMLGVGGRIGSGHQWMSWIALSDMVAALRFAADSASLRGPVNCVAPDAVRNSEFTDTLAKVLGRPAMIPVPEFALQLAFGEMATNTILASQRVVPKKLAGAGFQFRHPRLEEALRYELRR